MFKKYLVFNTRVLKVYTLPGYTYGEWVIFENNYPKFYYSDYDSNGKLHAFSKQCLEANSNMETVLIDILKQLGFDDLSFNPRSPFFKVCISKGAEEFDLLKLTW